MIGVHPVMHTCWSCCNLLSKFVLISCMHSRGRVHGQNHSAVTAEGDGLTYALAGIYPLMFTTFEGAVE